MAQLDAHPTADQEVANLSPPGGSIHHGIFSTSFSPFR